MPSELSSQSQQRPQAAFGEDCPEIVEATINHMMLSIAEGQVLRTVAPFVVKRVGKHVERQLTAVFSAPDQSAVGEGLVDLVESVL